MTIPEPVPTYGITFKIPDSAAIPAQAGTFKAANPTAYRHPMTIAIISWPST